MEGRTRLHNTQRTHGSEQPLSQPRLVTPRAPPTAAAALHCDCHCVVSVSLSDRWRWVAPLQDCSLDRCAVVAQWGQRQWDNERSGAEKRDGRGLELELELELDVLGRDGRVRAQLFFPSPRVSARSLVATGKTDLWRDQREDHEADNVRWQKRRTCMIMRREHGEHYLRGCFFFVACCCASSRCLHLFCSASVRGKYSVWNLRSHCPSTLS